MNDPETRKSKPFLGAPSPFSVLGAALSRVPGLKILFGVVAVLAILAIARVWSLDRGWTIVGGCAVLVFAVVLQVLAKLSNMPIFRVPATVLLWFCVGLFMVWCLLLTSCVFFKWPASTLDLPLLPVPPPIPDGDIFDVQAHCNFKSGLMGHTGDIEVREENRVISCMITTKGNGPNVWDLLFYTDGSLRPDPAPPSSSA